MKQKAIKRRLVKALLRPLLSWGRLNEPRDGFSIVVGTPWALRHLLEVNLRFLAATDLRQLEQIFVVFDRVRQPGAEQVISAMRSMFPQLPLRFLFQPAIAGRLVQLVDQSKFYAGLNWVTGLKHCRTRYAVLHDFDLYPVRPDIFVKIVEAMRDQKLHFSGVEFTHFDGLTDSDRLIGTWELGIDVQWIRANYRPIDCFHEVAEVNGRRVDLDGFASVQSRTPQRGLPADVQRDWFAHVTNLCSTYLRFSKGEPVGVAWRLPYLWYLESLVGCGRDIQQLATEMNAAPGAVLSIDDRAVDFQGTDPTCANVLRHELQQMETALFGAMRQPIRDYVDSFEAFLRTRVNAGSLEPDADSGSDMTSSTSN